MRQGWNVRPAGADWQSPRKWATRTVATLLLAAGTALADKEDLSELKARIESLEKQIQPAQK
jgi:hypothetical protein